MSETLPNFGAFYCSSSARSGSSKFSGIHTLSTDLTRLKVSVESIEIDHGEAISNLRRFGDSLFRDSQGG
jgi:hypothetical protein